jgi:tRNA1(Val) A37 N6-methylase TrmN6
MQTVQKHVIAIDPKADAITRAIENLPEALKGRVEFHQFSFEDFATNSKSFSFDTIIFGHSDESNMRAWFMPLRRQCAC